MLSPRAVSASNDNAIGDGSRSDVPSTAAALLCWSRII